MEIHPIVARRTSSAPRSEVSPSRGLGLWLMAAGTLRAACAILFVLTAQRALSEPAMLGFVAAFVALGGIGVFIGRGIWNRNQLSQRILLIALGAELAIEAAWLVFCFVAFGPLVLGVGPAGKVVLLLSYPTP